MRRLSVVERCSVAALLAMCLLAQVTLADEEDRPKKIILHPAAEARPALKYQLLPKFKDRIEGNAAVLYGKVTAEETRFFGNAEVFESLERWQEAPLATLRDPKLSLMKNAQASLAKDGIYNYLRRGARCTYCDWQFQPYEEDFYLIFLPELQQGSKFGMILGAHARIRIAHREYDESLDALQAGYALGRNMAESGFLLGALVGLRVADLMSDQVLEWVQQPESPNLYWALTMLPRPLIGLHEGAAAERDAIELACRELHDVRHAKHNCEEWRMILEQLCKRLCGWTAANPIDSAELVARSLKGYPQAKRMLIESGVPREEIEAMPVAQVILLYSATIYDEVRDEGLKALYLPYPDATKYIEAAQLRLKEMNSNQQEVVPLLRELLPAIFPVRTVQLRTERMTAVLRVFEAMRIYAAEHEGSLPASLGDIKSVPVPVDPITEEPFQWELVGGIGRLRGPHVAVQPKVRSLTGPVDYEVTMARK